MADGRRVRYPESNIEAQRAKAGQENSKGTDYRGTGTSPRFLRVYYGTRFFFATGGRLAEIQQVNRNEIDWQRGALMVLGKGDKEREVYFGAIARIWVQRYLRERNDNDLALFVTTRNHYRMSVHQMQYVFKRIAKRCGLETRVSPHKMRHTLATLLLNQGAPLVAVQSILGHEKPETTQLYATLSGASRQQSYQRYFVQ
ncbi:tyrosine-type recombinase/integrase [Alicyclobacillus ferrooxydans]|uniref:tyrosine-type recombinase/integrase n=1 Tax=Alicyclobacillus ferrooxydans TaxID=471514 RepID=UPI001470307F|nr:tyrosine-type recombinase/integrase [Alicyclobacillus ferrooxydans]